MFLACFTAEARSTCLFKKTKKEKWINIVRLFPLCIGSSLNGASKNKTGSCLSDEFKWEIANIFRQLIECRRLYKKSPSGWAVKHKYLAQWFEVESFMWKSIRFLHIDFRLQLTLTALVLYKQKEIYIQKKHVWGICRCKHKLK